MPLERPRVKMQREQDLSQILASLFQLVLPQLQLLVPQSIVVATRLMVRVHLSVPEGLLSLRGVQNLDRSGLA